MKTLTKKEQQKIIKAQSLITEAIFLLNSVDQTNYEFRNDSNRIALFNRIDGAKDIVDGIANTIPFPIEDNSEIGGKQSIFPLLSKK